MLALPFPHLRKQSILVCTGSSYRDGLVVPKVNWSSHFRPQVDREEIHQLQYAKWWEVAILRLPLFSTPLGEAGDSSSQLIALDPLLHWSTNNQGKGIIVLDREQIVRELFLTKQRWCSRDQTSSMRKSNLRELLLGLPAMAVSENLLTEQWSTFSSGAPHF